MPQSFEQIPPPPEDLSVSDISEPDYSVSLEDLALRARLNAVEVLEHELQAKRFMFDMRKKYALALFCLCVAWLIFIGFIIWSAGRAWIFDAAFKLSDAVLIALITTTTLNVLGLFLGVTLWLFPRIEGAGRLKAKRP